MPFAEKVYPTCDTWVIAKVLSHTRSMFGPLLNMTSIGAPCGALVFLHGPRSSWALVAETMCVMFLKHATLIENIPCSYLNIKQVPLGLHFIVSLLITIQSE